ncbi:MAG: type 4a pilus biogenesis protein PilO [Patescibacteria group bacterium]
MDKSEFIKSVTSQLGTKKTKDYIFLSGFFIAFSFFVFFAIKPSLTTAFELKEKEKELTIINNKYENIVANIIEVQSKVESVRDKLYLTNEALPVKPNINKLVKDIESSGGKNGIDVKKININEIDLKEQDNQTFKSLDIDMEVSSSFPNMLEFVKDLSDQRRLKKIKKITISRDQQEASTSSTLKMSLQLEGYYL